MKVFYSLASTEEFCTGAMKMRRQYNIVEKFLWIIWILIGPLEDLSAWTNKHQGFIGLIGAFLTAIFGVVAVFGFKVTPSELLEYFDNPILSSLLALFVWKFIIEPIWAYLTKSKRNRLYSKIKSQNKTIQLNDKEIQFLKADNLRMTKLISDFESQKNSEISKELKKEDKKTVKPKIPTKRTTINLKTKTDQEICNKGMQISRGILELIERTSLRRSELNAIERALMLEESSKYRVHNLSDALTPPEQPSKFKIAEANERKIEEKKKIAIQEYRNELQKRAQAYKLEILKRQNFQTDGIEDVNYETCTNISELKLIGQNLGQLSRTLEKANT